MHARAMLLTVLTTAGPLQAGIRSPANEWVDRFLPEDGPKIELPSYTNEIDRAKAQLRAGRFRGALSTLHQVENNADAERLRAEALARLGDFAAAEAVLTQPAHADQPDALALRLKLLLEQDQLQAMLPLAEQWLKVSPDSPQAHLAQGQLFEQLGRFDDAITAYKWIMGGQQAYVQRWAADPDAFEDADELTAIATCVDRWAVLSQSYKDLPQLNDTVLNMYLRAFDVLDREHIPSRIAAAGFALTRGDGAGAMKYIAPAWKAAPLDPEVMKMVAQIGIAQGGGQLEPAIIALRQAYPDSYFADVLEVIKLFNGQLLPQAAERAEVLAGKHPTRLEALGLRAAMGYLRGNERDLTVYLAKVDQLFSTRSDAHFLAATILDRAAQHDPAEALYKTALQRTPWLTDARHGLGDLYLNDGREDEARVVLDEAYRADPYNLSTVNYLRLLEEIAKYEKRETPHFILYFDPKADPIVADQIGPFMERCYDDLTKTFGFEPKQKVIVQIYPNDDEFSVRMAGVPGIENYGVSFGRVLATIAPRRGTKQGNFNWARVLRHELVHTINILQSKNRCPRWVTEGLAVWQEGVPFRFANVPPELYKRTMEGTLFRVRSFPLAFIAPKHPLDGEQAYTQGAYLAKYMVATYGSDSIVKLLNGYAQSMTDDEAFEHATGQPLTVMEDRWHAWMKTHLAAWNYDEATSKQVEALAKEGEQFIRAKAYGEALKVWQEAYDLQPTEVKPNQRLAFLYMQKDFQDLPKAIEHLKFLHVLELQNNRFAKQISRLYLRLDGLPNALKWAYEATYVDLYDASAHRLAADLYDKLNRSADAEAARQTANQIEVWDATRNKPAEQRNDEK